MDRRYVKDLDKYDPLLRADLDSEWYMGATNINGVTGNGRLTVGISYWGEITVFRWPTLSYYDHARYRTVHGFPFRNFNVRMGPDAPSESYRRIGRPIPARPDMGCFPGVYWPAKKRVLWLNEPSWETSQRYDPEDGNILLTRWRNDELGLLVSVKDFVSTEADVLIRRFELCAIRKPEEEVQLVHFFNFAPTTAVSRAYPVGFRLHEFRSDFLCAYNEREDFMIHFKPSKTSPRRARLLASELKRNPEKVTDFIETLDREFPSGGVFIACGLDRETTHRSVGRASSDLNPKIRGSLFEYISRGEFLPGTVEKKPACFALGAAFSSVGVDRERLEASVIISIAETASKAIVSLREARSAGADEIEKKTRSSWEKTSSSISLPNSLDEVSKAVAKRGILALKTGTDSNTKAMVASIARQPHYCFDWVRDGAFFDYALDLAGQTDIVTKHAYFYTTIQIRSKIFRRLDGNFWGNYLSDGRKGPFLILEIDETALFAWDLWRHARYLDGEERDRYFENVYPFIRNAANALMRKKRKGGGFPTKSWEDDNIFKRTSTLHGATSVYLGLTSAYQAGLQYGETESFLDSWKSWASDLREKIAECYDPSEKKFTNEGWRGGVWVIWPSRVLPFNDERVQNQARDLLYRVEPFIEKRAPGGAYVIEKLLACALAFRDKPAELERVREALSIIAHEIPTPGTRHFGEVALVVDIGGGEKAFQNRTAMPHLWEGVLFYLAATAAYEPERFDLADAPFSW